MNRCISLIKEVEREQEHEKRCARVKRSEEVYAAACDEAIQHGVTLTQRGGVFHLADNRHSAAFYSFTNTLFVQRIGETRGRVVGELPESDIYDVTLMFCEGRFLR